MVTRKPVCAIPNCGKQAPTDHPFCAAHRHDKRPYAHCCNGEPAYCDCVNKDHGFALFEAPVSAQQAAGEAEAWRYERNGVVRLFECRKPDYTTPAMGFTETPLYATPQPTETQRIVAWLREGNHRHPDFAFAKVFADAIEAGEHLAGEKA